MFEHTNLTLRPAREADRDQLVALLQRKSFIHRHLGWLSALDWLGSQPYLVLERESGLLAALACPSDEDGITWLQLFAVAPGFSVPRAWNLLWPAARKLLEEEQGPLLLTSLVIQPEMDRLLERSHFLEIDQVVVLVWENTQSAWPALNGLLRVRGMTAEDLDRVHQIDQLAFELIWRNSLSQLGIAYRTAYSATVVELEGSVQGYQISTYNPQGGHLARLAVNPAYHSRGIGSALVADLLERFQDRGILEVTVNTQSKNVASLDLYRRFGFRLLDDSYPVRQYPIREREF